jgi:hypothetical protein
VVLLEATAWAGGVNAVAAACGHVTAGVVDSGAGPGVACCRGAHGRARRGRLGAVGVGRWPKEGERKEGKGRKKERRKEKKKRKKKEKGEKKRKIENKEKGKRKERKKEKSLEN